MNLVRFKNLTKQFGSKSPPVFKDLNLTLPQNKFIGIVGPDGAGKTTLLRLIGGLLLPTEGSIEVLGFDTVSDVEKIRENSSYLPQVFGLYEDLTVEQNLKLYFDLRGETANWAECFQHLMDFTGLGPFKQRLARNLSGGMKQKLGLASTLIKKPKLLILDEPSVGVDPISRRELWKAVQGLLPEGVSVLWSTTYLEEAEHCDEIVLLNEGNVLFSGPPQELIQKNPRADGKMETAFIELLGGRKIKESQIAEVATLTPKEKEAVVKAHNVVKRFGSFTAVDHISVSVQQGEIFGVLGPNGAGKTTFFKMCCGLLNPTEGEVSILGIDPQKAPSAARSRIGYMAQKFSLYQNLTVLQNLQFFGSIYHGNVEERAARQSYQSNLRQGTCRPFPERRISFFKEEILQIMELLELKPYQNTEASRLPLGYKQRLALAVATMHWPDILFLDEATSGMDPVSRQDFWFHMKELVRKKNKTILITTHFMDEADNCDRIALIYKGTIIHLDTPEKLKELSGTNTLQDAFIRLIEEFDAKH